VLKTLNNYIPCRLNLLSHFISEEITFFKLLAKQMKVTLTSVVGNKQVSWEWFYFSCTKHLYICYQVVVINLYWYLTDKNIYYKHPNCQYLVFLWENLKECSGRKLIFLQDQNSVWVLSYVKLCHSLTTHLPLITHLPNNNNSVFIHSIKVHIKSYRLLTKLVKYDHHESHQLMLTSAQVVKTSVNVISNSPSWDYTHLDDHTSLTYDMTPGFKPFTDFHLKRTYKCNHIANYIILLQWIKLNQFKTD